MKMIKMALLGGAALAVTSAGAYADDLSALKAEIEALNARVAQLEATPAVPAGYQLMTVTTGDAIVVPGLDQNDPSYGKKATIISVLPTADAPATTEISWSGYARAILGRWDWRSKYHDDDTYINVRGEIRVVGKTDTSVGEVGATVKIRGDFDSLSVADAYMKEAWGWWAMTPELTLGGGYTGSISDVGFGLDAACNCYGTDNGGIYIGTGDAEQMRLTWASGPITIAGAIQDDVGPNGDDLAFAGRVKYSGDSFSAGVAGFYDNNGGGTHDEYEVTAGIGFGLDMFALSAMAGVGQERSGDDYWIASAIASVNLSDEIHAEVGYGVQEYEKHAVSHIDESNLIAGIYYDPVSQLTLGLEGEYINAEGKYWDAVNFDFVTVFRF